MASPWCFAEITHARALGKALFPLKVSACEIHPLLRSVQVTDLTVNPEQGFARLWRGLKAAGLDPADSFDWDGSPRPIRACSSGSAVHGSPCCWAPRAAASPRCCAPA
jgi:hypothetical protein